MNFWEFLDRNMTDILLIVIVVVFAAVTIAIKLIEGGCG